MHRAAQAGDIDALEAAIAAGADVNARDARGWTALMHAANKGYTLLVPLLLEAKAEVDIRAPDGATALFIAAVHGHAEVFACQGRRETRPKGGAKHCHRGLRGEMVRGGRDEAGGGVSRKRREGVARAQFPAGGDAEVRL